MSSSATALTKRSADSALMPPPPAPKRIKRPPKVLDEDTYTAALSFIIARDFFPGLLETESQQDYLNALDAGDEEWIDEAEKKVLQVMSTPRYGRSRRGVSLTPRRNEHVGETPRNWTSGTLTPHGNASTPAPLQGQEPTKKVTDSDDDEVDLSLSLSAFQAKYTSEDNESFNKVVDKQNASRAQKYSWMWNGNKIPSARQIAYAAREQRLLKSSSPSSSSSSSSQALILKPSQDLNERPASIDVKTTQNPRNNLMFDSADDISVTHPHLTTIAEAAQARSKAPPKSVSYSSTRLQTDLNNPNQAVASGEGDSDDIPASPSLSAIDAAIAGHPRHRPDSTAASIVDGNETPRVNGYAFVDAEPTPSEIGSLPEQSEAFEAAKESDAREAKKKDRNALLRRLILAGRGASNTSVDQDVHDISSSGINPFSIRESSKRESLHHRMVDKQLASKRSSTTTSRSSTPQHYPLTSSAPTATPKFGSAPQLTPASSRAAKKLGTLTPAAQQLYEKVGRTPSHRATQDKNDSPGKRNGLFGVDFSKAVGRERDRERQKRAWTSAGITPVSARRT